MATPPPEGVLDVRVRVLPLDVELTVHSGESMMAAAQRQGYFWPTRCRGQALCTACLFEVVSPGECFDPAEPLEQDALDTLDALQAKRTGQLRLGCQARPRMAATIFKRGVKPAEQVRKTSAWLPPMT
jgi:2Fe-2S ferredoxin